MERLFVLISPVTQSRNLRPTEVRNLRKVGVSCSENWMVSPMGNNSMGYLFRPCRTGGWDNANIELGPV